jgi:hypothetical protein
VQRCTFGCKLNSSPSFILQIIFSFTTAYHSAPTYKYLHISSTVQGDNFFFLIMSNTLVFSRSTSTWKILRCQQVSTTRFNFLREMYLFRSRKNCEFGFGNCQAWRPFGFSSLHFVICRGPINKKSELSSVSGRFSR